MSVKIETSPMANLKAGSNKLLDNGLTTLIKLLVIALVVYGLYQAMIYVSLKDALQDLSSALKVFEGDPSQSVIAKDAIIEFAKNSGPIAGLYTLLIGLLSLVYNLATTKVYLNSIRNKDTSLSESIKLGLTRSWIAILFGLYVFAIIIGFFALSVMIAGLLPIALVVIIPAFFVLLVMLFIRLFYSMEILVDDKKPKVMSIFEESKKLFRASSNAALYYILFSVALLIIVSLFFTMIMNLLGAGPSNSYGFTTGVNDIVYNLFNYLFFSVFGFFLTAGFVEIYNQAKLSVAPTSINKPSKKTKAKSKK